MTRLEDHQDLIAHSVQVMSVVGYEWYVYNCWQRIEGPVRHHHTEDLAWFIPGSGSFTWGAPVV